MDGATPIVVIDTDDILKSLQVATQKNKQEAAAAGGSSRNHINGSA